MILLPVNGTIDLIINFGAIGIKYNYQFKDGGMVRSFMKDITINEDKYPGLRTSKNPPIRGICFSLLTLTFKL
jgi:hypothetical protein